VLDHIEFRPARTARQAGTDEFLAVLADAIAARRACRTAYISFHDRKQLRLTLHPLRLVFIQRAWYLLAYSRRFGEIRTFKLARIKRLDVLDKTFTPPDPVEVAEHFGAAWNMIPEGRRHDIHLRFDRDVAGTVAEVQWHDSQRTEWLDDGRLDFHVRVDGLGEITWWILGYGDKVRVIKPEALARKVQGAARRIVARYADRGRAES